MNPNQPIFQKTSDFRKKPGFLPVMMLIMLLLFCKQVDGQKGHYEDLIAELDQITNEQAFSRLFRHQGANQYFSNTYIQLGHVCEKMLEGLDPLRQIHQVKHLANNAILYYQLFSVYLENNEVRRTRNLYQNIPIESSGRRLNNEDVIKYINERVKIVNNYLDSVVLIYDALERSKDHYNYCIRLFFEINEEYDQLKETLLQADEMFLQRIDALQQAFDACTTAFTQYKHLISLFPIKSYNQTYTLQSINTFRLDGLTNSDFLKDTIVLWDFGQWVREFRNSFTENIIALRNDIERIQQTIDNNMLYINSVKYTNHTLPASQYDNLFVYRLGIYDSYSLIRELFNYLHERQAFQMMTKDSLNSPAYISSAYLNRKFRYYYRMALQLKHTEEKLRVFSGAIDPQRIRRFRDFFDFYYNGEPGIHAFTSKERDMLFDEFSNGLNNLTLTLQNEKSLKHSWSYASGSSGLQISLIPNLSNPFFPGNDAPTTRSIFFENDMPVYAGGIIYHQQTHKAFISKVSEDLTIEWHQEFDHGQYTTQLFGYENGVIAIVTIPGFSTNYDTVEQADQDTVPKPTYHLNTLIHLDKSGKTEFTVQLDETHYPLYLYYDDINKLYRIVYGSPTERPDVYDEFIVCVVDSTGLVEWKTSIHTKGSFAGLFKAEDQYLLFTNFISNDSNAEAAAIHPEKNWACMLTHISSNGAVIKTNTYPSAKSYYIDRTFGISSDEFNLVGYKGVPTQISGQPVYMIISANGEQVFHNLK